MISNRITTNLPLLATAIIGLAIATMNSLGNFFVETDPAGALAVSPYNYEARLALTATLADASDAPGPDILEQALELTRQRPADARSYAVLGEVYLKSRNLEAARAAFAQSEQLSKTEPLTLMRTMAIALEDGDLAKVAEKLETLLRRRPAQARQSPELVAAIVSLPEARPYLLRMMHAEPKLGRTLLSLIPRDAQGAYLNYQLMTDMQREGITLPRELVEQAIGNLVTLKAYAAAFQLYQTTLTGEDRDLAGYIYDGEFTRRPDTIPYHWRVWDTSGTRATWRENLGQQGGVEVTFLGKPVRSVGVQQNLALPAGSYVFSTTFQTRALQAPKGLHWQLRCVTSRSPVFELPIEEGSRLMSKSDLDFTIDDDNCPLYMLEIRTDLVAESLSYRYLGTMVIDAADISWRQN